MPSATTFWCDLDRNLVATRIRELEQQVRRELAGELGHFAGDDCPLVDPANPMCRPFLSAVDAFAVLVDERARQWVDKAAQIYCEVWEGQGNRVSPEVASNIRFHGLDPFIRDQISGLLLEAFQLTPASLRLLDSRYSQCIDAVKVQIKWNALQRVMTVLQRYGSSCVRLTVPFRSATAALPPDKMEYQREGPSYADPGSWRDLEARFRELQRDDTHGMIASWISTAWNEAGEQWYLSGSQNKRLETYFKWTADRAAIKRGHAFHGNAYFAWLDLLKNDSPNFRIDSHGSETQADGIVSHHEGGTIYRLCEASADFCLKLENDDVTASMLLGDARPAYEQSASNPAAGEQGGHTLQPSSEGPSSIEKLPKDASRRALVDMYIDEVFKKTGQRITRTDIWRSARYKTRTEFERWQRQDTKNPNKAADERFARILIEKPHLK